MTAGATAAGGFSVRPMAVGAEIVGLAQGAEQEPAVAAALHAAWLDHGILLFRDVDSIDYHLALSRVFGELELHPYPEMRSALDPLLIELGGVKRAPAYVYDESELRLNRVPWHRDSAFTPDVCKGAMLRMVIPAREEGETFLSDTAAAYDDLPAAMKWRIAGLEYKATLKLEYPGRPPPGALWRTMRRATEEEDPGGRQSGLHDVPVATRYPAVVQPVVLRHPQSGRPCLLLSPSNIDRILGLDETESSTLLAELVDHMLQPKYVYRHRWRANDAIVWDNIRFMHAAPGHRIDDQRFGLRTTLAGAVHTGRYFDADVEAVTSNFAD
jgi:taurine dioxygenase